MVLAAFLAAAQIKTIPLTDEQITHLRVGRSFDANELAYFGLFAAHSADSSVTRAYGIAPGERVVVDSARYGYTSGAFYVEPFVRGNPKKLLLSPAAQNEFCRLIAQYEQLAQDPRSLNLSLLAPLRVQVPLYKHEHHGRYAEAEIGKRLYFGEVAFVTPAYVGLYDVDLGYDPEIAEQELKILALDSIDVIRIYNRNLARFVGLGIGVAVAGTFSAFGFTPVQLPSEQAAIAANFVILPALGFGIGYLIDKAFEFNTEYKRKDAGRWYKGLNKLRGKTIFTNQLPPEIRRRLSVGL